MTFFNAKSFDNGIDGLHSIPPAFSPFLRLSIDHLCPFNQGRKNGCQTSSEDQLGKVADGLCKASAVMFGDVKLREVVMNQLRDILQVKIKYWRLAWCSG